MHLTSMLYVTPKTLCLMILWVDRWMYLICLKYTGPGHLGI